MVKHGYSAKSSARSLSLLLGLIVGTGIACVPTSDDPLIINAGGNPDVGQPDVGNNQPDAGQPDVGNNQPDAGQPDVGNPDLGLALVVPACGDRQNFFEQQILGANGILQKTFVVQNNNRSCAAAGCHLTGSGNPKFVFDPSNATNALAILDERALRTDRSSSQSLLVAKPTGQVSVDLGGHGGGVLFRY